MADRDIEVLGDLDNRAAQVMRLELHYLQLDHLRRHRDEADQAVHDYGLPWLIHYRD